DRPAPVGIAAEHAAVGFGGLVVHAVLAPAETEYVGMLLVRARQRANAVGAEEFVFVQHLLEDPAEALFVDDRHEAAIAVPATAFAFVMNAFEQRRHAADALLEVRRDLGDTLALPRFDDRRRAERAQPDQRTHLQP